ncbi:hypothetical protein [Tardiphaga robiniae]|uniref:hypothetical protein n=1 Tax=Tardiphaga robiniae TaxID=943830 RepID=UPI001586CA60|nr:hypothetical protein [Tardiphaga robiniae]NUU41374.1 hypothetical protein [Tardiphaga robiniae]
MSWENDASSYLAELSRSPGGQQPATLGQVWDSEWKRTSLDTIAGVGQPFGDARADLVTAIETASGRPIADYAAQMGVKLGAGVTQAEDIRLLGSLADTLPEDKRKTIEPLKDIRLNAAKKAQKIEADADDIGNATYGLSAHATAFIAGVARQAADPVNVAAMVATAPLGAARGASLLATIGREAGANAAAQAIVEPVIEPQRERLGVDSGFGRAAGNIFEAGVGGAALSGLFHVAGRGLRALRGERPAEAVQPSAPAEGVIVPPAAETRIGESGTAPAASPDPAPAGALTPQRSVEQFAPDDFHAAGDLAERDHVVDVMSPVDTAEGRLDHAVKVDDAADRIELAGSPSKMAGPSDADVLAEVSKWASGADAGANLSLLPEAVYRFGQPLQAETTFYRGEWPGAPDLQRKLQATSVSDRLGAQSFATSRNDVELERMPQDGGGPPRLPLSEIIVPANTKVFDAGPHAGANAGELERMLPPGEFKLVRTRTEPWTFAGNPAEYVIKTYRFIPDADGRVTELKSKAPRGRAAADPETFSLNEFIVSQGGLKPDPELAAIYGTARGPFVPGFGPLIRKGGKSLDDALRAAKDAGYLVDPRDMDGPDNGTLGLAGRRDLGLTPNDLLDRLDAENRGQKLYKPGQAREAAIDDGQEAHAIVGALEKELYDTGAGDTRIDQAIADRVVQIVRQEKETDLLSAYERAIMEDAERYEGLAAARQADAELGKIAGWDADELGTASRDGTPDPQQRRQAERAGQGDSGKDGAASRDAGDGAGTPRQLGDPALAADAARALEDAGGDLEITLINPDGTMRTLKASDALREVEEDARAADELNACIVGAAEEAPF